jgi:AraC-like DNA-binding protein
MIYMGPIHATGAVVYSSSVLCVSLGDVFKYREGRGEWVERHVVFTPAGVVHEVQATPSTVIAKYWVEKESPHNSCLTQAAFFLERDYLLKRKSIISTFQYIYAKSLSSYETKKCLDYLFKKDNLKCDICDPRILYISKLIRDEPDYNFSIDRLASEVDLSSSRLLHLIKEETGVSYRRFRMWQRVRYALSIYGLQNSLTYSSFEAGFNDSAHFTRCFKSFYGATPSSVLKTLEKYEVNCVN